MARAPDWQVVVNGQERLSTQLVKGYMCPRSLIALLPYWPKLEEWMSEYLNHLEMGIITAVLAEDRIPGLKSYMVALKRLINLSGLKINKEHLLRLIKLVYLILTKEGHPKNVVLTSAQLLFTLIDDSRLGWKELILDWKPVFALYKGIVFDKIPHLSGIKMEEITPTIMILKRFYDPKEIYNIWQELQVFISPRGRNMPFFCDFCIHFLPDRLTGEEQKQVGAVHWWNTVWQLYTMVEQNGFWGQEFPKLFASVAYFAPDFVDLSAQYEYIFTSILRSMELSTLKGKVSIDSEQDVNIKDFGVWVGSLLGGPRSCQPQLARLMECIENFLHPAHVGAHTGRILDFMQALSDRITERLYRERIKKHKHPIPTEFYLSDQDLEQFVRVLIQPTLTALFNKKGEEVVKTCLILRNIAALNPEAVLPHYLKHIYASLHAIPEPHRLRHVLAYLISVVYQISADNQQRVRRNLVEDFAGEIDKIREMTGKDESLTKEERNWLATNQSLLSLRVHLIHLLEALIAAVNVNDLENSECSLRNIVLIYSLIPNIDASPCLEIHADKLTEDEKELCRLTRKLPQLADYLFDKILRAIECFGCCMTRDGVRLLEGLNDGETEIGQDELDFIKTVNKAVSIVMGNSSEQIANSLVNKVFEFCTKVEFESQVATSMTVQIVEETVYSRPEAMPRFAEFILKKLRELLPEEVRSSTNLSKTALFYINLAGGLFSATSEAFIQNKTVCIEILDLLTSCECKFAHSVGATALNSALFMLTKTYTLSAEKMKEKMRRRLTEWIPIREWAQLYQEHEVNPAWHVPDESRRVVAKELISRFVFPLLEKINAKETTKFARRRYIAQLSSAYKSAYNCFDLPLSAAGPEVNPPAMVIPSPKLESNRIPLVYWNVPYQGYNMREAIVDVLERMIDWMALNNADDHEALNMASELLKIIICEKTLEASQIIYLKNHITEFCTFLLSPIDKKRFRENSIDMQISFNHFFIVSSIQMPVYTAFQERICCLLFKLAIHQYPEVRETAIADLKDLLETFSNARSRMVELTVEKLRDPEITDSQMRGVILLIQCNEWLIRCSSWERYQLWAAIVEMKMPELGNLIGTFEKFKTELEKLKISNKPPPIQPTGELESFCFLWWQRLPARANQRWKNFTTKPQIDAAKMRKKEMKKERQKHSDQLVTYLIQASRKKNLHHSRYKLIRAMLWRCQRADSNLETIRILLGKLTDREDKNSREHSTCELGYYMSNNKPKVRKITWQCPERRLTTPPNSDGGVLMNCGIRDDNMVMAYNSQNLPNSEEKWNKTLFCSKAYGCYKWPTTIQMRVPTSESIFDPNRVLTLQEQCLAVWFDNKENVFNWLELVKQDKRDEVEYNQANVNLIKYVLRNFPDHPNHLTYFREYLAELFKSNERECQRLAAEIFFGIARGTRHRPWKLLNELWSWLAPEVDSIFYKLTKETQNIWIRVVQRLRNGDDSRRFYWLIEKLLVGLQRPIIAPQLALRADLIPANRWRDVDIMVRMNEIVWNKLSKATLKMQSQAIASNITYSVLMSDACILNDFHSIPERFRPIGPSNWMLRFEKKIIEISGSKDTGELDSPRPIRAKTTGSETSIVRAVVAAGNERLHPIYIHALLCYLGEYYDYSICSLTATMIKLFPLIIKYATEEDKEDNNLQDYDIQERATVFAHSYMSACLLSENLADGMLKAICETFNQPNQSWKVRVSILKFLQVLVFSNVFICERGNRPLIVVGLLFEALIDGQSEVRQEAADALQALIHFKYIRTNSALIKRLRELLDGKGRSNVHGGILGLAAVVLAHPFETPPEIVPAIELLCKIPKKHADLREAASNALRDFRQTHRDVWKTTAKILGRELIYHVENATAPIYYV